MSGGVLVCITWHIYWSYAYFLHCCSTLADPCWSFRTELLLFLSPVLRQPPPRPLPLVPLGTGQIHLTRPGAWWQGAQGLVGTHLTGTDDSRQEWSIFGRELQKVNSGSEAWRSAGGGAQGDSVHHRDARGTFTQCDVILLVTTAVLQACDMHVYYLSSRSTVSSHLLTFYNSVGIRWGTGQEGKY